MRVLHMRRPSKRTGVAAVELAFLLPLLLGLIVGVWELGRILMVQQILNNAARDGARLAAQAKIINMLGSYTEIRFSSGSPNVRDTITSFLTANGITNQAGLQVSFEFLNDDLTPDTSITEPYQGPKNKKFRVRVSIPYQNVRWTTLTLINPTTISAEATWQMMVDDPFTLETSLPGWTP